MNDPRNCTDTTETAPQQQQTETSPLKQNDTKKHWLSSFFCPVNDTEHGSLKPIILNFLILSIIVTIGLVVQLYYGGFAIDPHGSVATDSVECSQIGINVLKKGGNAVDAAIAATICLGVVNFYITGLGGGGYMMIYNHKHHKVLDLIDFQPTVPNSYGEKKLDVSIDGLTVGVPGLLMGLWEAHQKFGNLLWKDLIMPASYLAKYGFKVDKNAIYSRSHLTFKTGKNENLVVFLEALKENENITFPELAASLELIASKGAHALYNGSLAMDILYSVNEAKGNMTLDDIAQYKVSHSELLHTTFGNFNILAPGSSSAGALLLNALDNIQILDLNSQDEISSDIIKIMDVLHETYLSFLEKNKAAPSDFDPVASEVIATDNQDLYVVVVSGLNTWLGSQLLTGAGFILNNAIVNGGINNERRPLSYSTPVIALESGEVCGKRLILGSGDASIAAQVLTNALILNYNLSSSIEAPRFFIESKPRHIKTEEKHQPTFNPLTLKKIKPLVKIERIMPPYKSVNAVQKVGDSVEAYSDSRGGGEACHFK